MLHILHPPYALRGIRHRLTTMPPLHPMPQKITRKKNTGSHVNTQFNKLATKLVKDPTTFSIDDTTKLKTLYGNPNWVAPHFYLWECLTLAMSTTGHILETGSGLSSLFLAAGAMHANTQLTILEHDPTWYHLTGKLLSDAKTTNTTLIHAPLNPYPTYDWYSYTKLPYNITLIACDGPPSTTRGGRSGIMETINYLGKDCTILLDDVNRQLERKLLEKLTQKLEGKAYVGGIVQLMGKIKVD
jgi:hypothetical protein